MLVRMGGVSVELTPSGDAQQPEGTRMNMQIAHTPRRTSYGLNPGDELNDLRMSEQVRPLYDLSLIHI